MIPGCISILLLRLPVRLDDAGRSLRTSANFCLIHSPKSRDTSIAHLPPKKSLLFIFIALPENPMAVFRPSLGVEFRENPRSSEVSGRVMPAGPRSSPRGGTGSQIRLWRTNSHIALLEWVILVLLFLKGWKHK